MTYFSHFCKAQCSFNSKYSNFGGLLHNWRWPRRGGGLRPGVKILYELCAFGVTICKI